MIVSGKVIAGAGRSRLFGYPTANVDYAGELDLVPAVYAGHALVGDDRFACVICYGARVVNEKRRFEVHLFDFEGDLYGRDLKVEVGDKCNELAPIKDETLLAAKIASDVEKAKEVLGI
ncbi:MAG: riboflavin kinase [Candidatus Uhrbacteria bacterium]|nr:riboflavin kinase [Patescibacteria group bacterium]MBU1906769.1 riboflavin kinase [Patescibacteria group bacterium]